MDKIRVGIDWWRTASHHRYFARIARLHLDAGDEVLLVSAIGRSRAGTIEAEALSAGFPFTGVREVVFGHPREAPALKSQLCRELGISVFYDDREDTCAALRDAGVLALRVMVPGLVPGLLAPLSPLWDLTRGQGY